LGTLWQDIRFGLRVLYKSPGFAAVAILTLALGIGANTAIFSYIDAWLIKPLPYPQADRLMVLLSHDTQKGWTEWGVTSTADFGDYQQQNTSFDQLVPWAVWSFNLTNDGPPERTAGGRVGWNFFQTLDVKPILGRAFLPQESQPGNDHEVILNEGLWKSRFASDPHIIGRQMTVDGESCTIVGVVPGKFQFPLLGLSNMWTPIALTPEQRADRNGDWFQAFGRLKPGVTQAQAAAELGSIAARLAKLYPGTNTNLTTLLSPMTYEIGKEEGTQQVLICMCIVGLILLIACANVANLMLARATRRTKEFALRTTLGATRSRLIRQLLTESMLLFFFGGAGGVLFGMWGTQWIQSAIPERIRGYLVNYGQVKMDWTTLAFTLGIALFCGLVFGLAPAFQSSRLDLNREIKESSGQASSSSHGARLRRIFVAGEIALAVVVLISTTLLVESFIRMVGSDLGFRAQGVVTTEIELSKTGYPSDAQIRNFEEALHSRILAIPGAQSATISQFIPFSQYGDSTAIHVVGKPPEPAGESIGAMDTAVSPDFFSTMQIPLLRGRTFTSLDDSQSPLAVVINQTLVEQQFGTKDPIGQKLEVGDKHTVFDIVGVVGNVKFFNLAERPRPEIYFAFAQRPGRNIGIAIRSANPTSLAGAIRDAVWSVDSSQPVSAVRTLEDRISEQNTGNSILTDLVGFFGALALLLGAIGIYGVMAISVAQRTREIGIRTALGATPQQVMRMVIGQGLRLSLVGIVIGLLAAAGATRALSFMLYQVNASDPWTFAGVAVAFALIALLACYIPARRATRVDPMVALRYE
jgi:putative ABC transport system permease protein